MNNKGINPKRCPFCGSMPAIEPWHGGPKSKRMIHCESEECYVNPGVTGKTAAEAVEKWNERASV